MRYEILAVAYRDLEHATARDDKAPEDATAVDELVELYRSARRAPAGA